MEWSDKSWPWEHPNSSSEPAQTVEGPRGDTVTATKRGKDQKAYAEQVTDARQNSGEQAHECPFVARAKPGTAAATTARGSHGPPLHAIT